MEPLKVCCHPAKFSGLRHCGSGDIMALVCHVILDDHVIKGLCNFKDESPSLYVITLSNLVSIDIVAVEICFSGWWLKSKIPQALAEIRCYCLSPPKAHGISCSVHVTHSNSNNKWNIWKPLVVPSKNIDQKEREGKKKKTMTTAELFALQANAIIMVTITELKNLEKIGSVENNLLCLPHIS